MPIDIERCVRWSDETHFIAKQVVPPMMAPSTVPRMTSSAEEEYHERRKGTKDNVIHSHPTKNHFPIAIRVVASVVK